MNRKIVLSALVANKDEYSLKAWAKFCAKFIGILLTIYVLVVAYVHFKGKYYPDPPYFAFEFALVEEGEGVELAAAYEGQGIHPITMPTYSNWDRGCLPREWLPTNVTEVQLVVFIKHERELVLEVCEYAGGPDVTRFQYCVDVKLREAKTGRLIASSTLYGSVPRECRWLEAFGQTRLEGSRVSAHQLRTWLETYVVTDVSVNSGSSASFEVYVNPGYNDIEVGEEFSVSIDITGVAYPGIFGYELILNFNPAYLEATYTEIPNGHFLTPTSEVPPGLLIVQPGVIDNTAGTVSFAVTLTTPEEGKTGSGILGTITFRGKAEGLALLTLEEVVLVDPDAQAILENQYVLKNGSVNIQL
ncbi:MAG: cohesin domain-containing protein [Candidatus Bathyarchaeota archaeon]|nr:cohesin domain-containing protein [Candidatus Bathyarchaeota archaeon]